MTSYVKVDLWVRIKLGIGVVLTLSCVNVTDCFAEDSEDIVDIFGTKNERMISIATGLSQPVTKAPGVASVIDAEEIERIGAITLGEVLETIAGIHVTPVRGFVPSFVIRGIFNSANNNVLIMVDGTPMNDAGSNSLLLTHSMMTKNISRIEIVKGPGSAVYGQDAFAGVINIVTKAAGEINGTAVGSFAGSFDTYGGWFLGGDKIGDNSVSLSVQGRTTNGQKEKIDSDAQTQFDQLFGTNASRAPGSLSTGRDDIDIRLKVSNNTWYDLRLGYQSMSNGGNGAGTLLALDPEGIFDVDLWTSALTLKHTISNWNMKADLSYLGVRFHSSANLFPRGAFGGVFEESVRNDLSIKTHQARAEICGVREFANHRLRLGLGYTYATGSDTREKRNFLLAPGNVIVPAGRFDDVEVLGQNGYSDAKISYTPYQLWSRRAFQVS